MKESLRKNRKGILWMALSSVCVCLGQLLWKLAASQGLLILLAGFGLYGAGALAMLIAYRYGKVSVLQPMLSLNYVVSLGLGAAVWGEPITLSKSLGVFLVILGLLCIAGGEGNA